MHKALKNIIDITGSTREESNYRFRIMSNDEKNLWIAQIGRKTPKGTTKVIGTLISFTTEDEARAAAAGFIEGRLYVEDSH